jgi:hypothetical protein
MHARDRYDAEIYCESRYATKCSFENSALGYSERAFESWSGRVGTCEGIQTAFQSPFQILEHPPDHPQTGLRKEGECFVSLRNHRKATHQFSVLF